ncbi:MAG: TlpA disulfide reductase family protein [Gemmataceae bacterium]
MRRALPVFLAIVLAASPLLADDAAKQLTELLKPYDELLARFRASTDLDEKRAMTVQARTIVADISPKLLDLARTHAGSPPAVDALLWLVGKAGSADEGKEAMKLLVANYLTSDRIGPLCDILETDRANGEQYLSEIRTRNPNKTVKLLAGLSLGRVIAVKPNPTEEQRRDAEKILTEVVEEGRKHKGFPEDRVMAAEKTLFELRNLTVGKTPPDLEGTTLDGKRAKLSDYRGKVTVVTVWATHALPAREMIPGQRGLMQKFAGKPFAMLSISADPDKARLTDFLKREPMPWDHWWNGQKGGVFDTWTINFFPTVYVLDAKGVIRHKNLNPKQLDEAVGALLNEK